MSAIFKDLTNLSSLECDYCHKSYCGKRALQDHISKKHQVANRKTKSVTREFECPFECDKSYKHKKHLNDHMKICKANPTNKQTLVPAEPTTVPTTDIAP